MFFEISIYSNNCISTIERILKNDPSAMLTYQGILSISKNTNLVHGFYSNSINQADKLLNLLENENNIPELVSEGRESVRPRLRIGDYDNIIDLVFNLERFSKQLPPNEQSNDFWDDLYTNLLLATCYTGLGQPEIGMDLINQIDTTKLKYPWWKTTFYYMSANVYARYGNQKKADQYMKNGYRIFKKIYDEKNNFWDTEPDHTNNLKGRYMYFRSYLAKNDLSNAMTHITPLEKLLSQKGLSHQRGVSSLPGLRVFLASFP